MRSVGGEARGCLPDFFRGALRCVILTFADVLRGTSAQSWLFAPDRERNSGQRGGEDRGSSPFLYTRSCKEVSHLAREPGQHVVAVEGVALVKFARAHAVVVHRHGSLFGVNEPNERHIVEQVLLDIRATAFPAV